MATDVKTTPIDPQRVAELTMREEERFRRAHSRSGELWERARHRLTRNTRPSRQDAQPLPIFAKEGKGSHITDVDGSAGRRLRSCPSVVGTPYPHPQIVEAVSARI